MTAECKPRGPFHTGLLTPDPHGPDSEGLCPAGQAVGSASSSAPSHTGLRSPGESLLPVFLPTLLSQRPTPPRPYSTYRSGVATLAPNYPSE